MNEAFNCGNHDWYDPAKEEAERLVLWKKQVEISDRLSKLGFETTPHDISLEDDGFRFLHERPLRFSDLDKLSTEFDTKRIDFVKGGGYHDTCGYHETNYVIVQVSK